MRAVVSSCFLINSRYDGKRQQSSQINRILDLLKRENVEIIPLCPEQLGGLATPRIAAERKGGQVITKDGRDVSINFKKGAQLTLELYEQLNADFAILKEASPSCGVHQIYDGSHSQVKVKGQGVTCELLVENAIAVYSENDFEKLEKYLKGGK